MVMVVELINDMLGVELGTITLVCDGMNALYELLYW